MGVDSRPESELGARMAELRAEGVELQLGARPPLDAFERVDLVVVSPGVPLGFPEIAHARERRVPIWGEVELASRFLDKGRVADLLRADNLAEGNHGWATAMRSYDDPQPGWLRRTVWHETRTYGRVFARAAGDPRQILLVHGSGPEN